MQSRKLNLYLPALLVLVGLSLSVVLFSTVEVAVSPSYSTSLATAQSVSAESWLVFDVKTGEIIYSHNAGVQLPIASLTKLASAAVSYHSDEMWATTSITWNDVTTEGQAGHLQFGEVYTLHTLLFPLLLESSNDAAAVFVRVDADLVTKMNDYVSRLGLTQTHFADTSGLSPENVSTANDLLILTRDIYYNSRHLMDITSLQSYLIPKKGWLNINPVANDEAYLGGKHGYTPEAGRTLIAFFQETLASGTEKEIGYIVLKSTNLTHDINLLRNTVQNYVMFK